MEKIRFIVDGDVADLVPRYLAGRRRDVQTLTELVAREAFAEIGEYGHRMAGSGRAFGFSKISAVGREIESAAARRDAIKVSRAVSRLGEYLDAIVLVFPAAE